MAKIKPRPERKHGVKVSNASTNPDRPKDASSGGSNRRSQATIKRLNMYRGGKPTRNRKGQIVKAADYQSELGSGTQARVAPNRRWFGNTRVITQSNLQKFQEEVGKAENNPYKVILNPSKLPMSLLRERSKHAKAHILDTESFEHTFGKKKRRKRPNLPYSNLTELVQHVEKTHSEYDVTKDSNVVRENIEGTLDPAMANYLGAGQSRRIWNELYKVVDCSDVVIQVLDARNPMGTRCHRVEKYLKAEKPHKHLIFVLNKCDLVPSWVAKAWVAKLSSERPTVAFHASINNWFGKHALIQLLRQFSKLHSDKKNISCGFIGYPNVGKSSVINTLCKKAVCKAAPLAGETKVWQYITLFNRIFLIDCPGIVQPSGDSETDIILKGVVRVENCKQPDEHIGEVLRRAEKKYIVNTYAITDWTDSEDFLNKMAYKTGKLLKGGVPDWNACAKKILNDWQRGEIPYYCRPPDFEDHQQASTSAEVEAPEVEIVDDRVNKLAPTAIELERKLAPLKQDFDKAPTRFKFDEDGKEIYDGPTSNDNDKEEIEVEEGETSKVEEDVGETSNVEEDDEVADDGDVPTVPKDGKKPPLVGEGPTMQAGMSVKDKMKRLKKQRKRQEKKEDSVFDLSSLDKFQEKRRMEEERAKEAVIANIKKRRERGFDYDSEEEKKSELTSKEKRRKARDSKTKKTGNNYYDKVNVKKRKRNPHNPKADVSGGTSKQKKPTKN